jgi:RNA-binding protein
MLTTKQRAYLKSLASVMDPIFQIGKSGAAPELVNALNDALEKRELIKVNVLNNCFEDIRALAEVIASRTHSEVVQVIGHRIVFYRPSKKPHIELPH